MLPGRLGVPARSLESCHCDWIRWDLADIQVNRARGLGLTYPTHIPAQLQESQQVAGLVMVWLLGPWELSLLQLIQ